MEFKVAYLEAMRQQAPQMFNRLRKTGALDAHVQKVAKQASELFEMLTADEPKLPNGLPKSPVAIREAEEQVLATLIDFPQDETPET